MAAVRRRGRAHRAARGGPAHGGGARRTLEQVSCVTMLIRDSNPVPGKNTTVTCYPLLNQLPLQACEVILGCAPCSRC